MKRIIIATATLFVTGAAIPSDAFACSCATLTLAQRFGSSDNVFTAVVTDEYVESRGERQTVHSIFAITESFKGTQSFGTLVSQPDDGFSCGIDIDEGVEYLIFAPDSGDIGLCSGVSPIGMAEAQLAALRAFSSGRNPDLSEPWYFFAREQSCRLSVIFQQGEEHFIGGDLQFLHHKQLDVADNATELKIRVGVYDIKPEGAHNPLQVVVGSESYFLPWSTDRSHEQVLPDGTSRTLSYAGDFVLRGRQVTEILAGLQDVDAVSVRFDASGFGLDVNARVGTANLRNGASEMLSCIRLN